MNQQHRFWLIISGILLVIGLGSTWIQMQDAKRSKTISWESTPVDMPPEKGKFIKIDDSENESAESLSYFK